jgi:hypothetical protein
MAFIRNQGPADRHHGRLPERTPKAIISVQQPASKIFKNRWQP